MEINALVEKYISLRDRKASMKAEFDAKVEGIDVMLKKVEAHLQKFFADTGTESVKTANGTAYKSLRTSTTVADSEAYFNWIGEDFENRKAFLEKRANKSAVEEYAKEHADTPPGVSVHREYTVNIRRS